MGCARPRGVDATEALDRLRHLLEPMPPGLNVGIDDLGDLAVWTRRDMLHLDADALNDRLHHWTQTQLRERLPDAAAHVSFHHARPASPHDDPELDLQERWLDLEPTVRLEIGPHTRPEDVVLFARLVPRFLALLERTGRPEGYRQPDVGATE